jgi:hypothetical protein
MSQFDLEMLPTHIAQQTQKLNDQFRFQVSNPTETNVFMSNVPQCSEIIEHITFKKGLPVTKHVVHIPLTYLYYYYEITNKNIF